MRFRLPFQKEHRKRVSTIFKSERQHLRHISCSMGRQFSCKKSLLGTCQRLRLFVKTMLAVDKCFLRNRDDIMQPIHMQLSQKLKTFCSFILHFQNLDEIFHIFRKKMTLIAYSFPRLRSAKGVVRYMCKSCTSDYPSKRKLVNGSQLSLNLSDSTCSIFVARREGNIVAKSHF